MSIICLCFAEYVYTLKVDEKSDIYSFGVVLLELVTGRRPFEPEYGEGVDISAWVKRKVQTREGVMEVLDSKILKEEVDMGCNNLMGEVMQVSTCNVLCKLVHVHIENFTLVGFSVRICLL